MKLLETQEADSMGTGGEKSKQNSNETVVTVERVELPSQLGSSIMNNARNSCDDYDMSRIKAAGRSAKI